jgi:hypothetical protein
LKRRNNYNSWQLHSHCKNIKGLYIAFVLLLPTLNAAAQPLSQLLITNVSVNGIGFITDAEEAVRSLEDKYIHKVFDLSPSEGDIRLQHTYFRDSLLFLFIENEHSLQLDAILLKKTHQTVILDGGIHIEVGDSLAKLAILFPESYDYYSGIAPDPVENTEFYVELYVSFSNQSRHVGIMDFTISEGIIRSILIRYQPGK